MSFNQADILIIARAATCTSPRLDVPISVTDAQAVARYPAGCELLRLPG